MCVFYPKTPQNYRSCKKIPASHFNKVGSAFWAKYVNYIITYGKKYTHPYGDASCNNAGICGVGEMWGYAMGYLRCDEKYRNNRTEYPGKNYWFKPQIIWELNKKNILTKGEILNCMTSNVQNHNQLKAKMKSTYKSKSSQIEKIFNQHGF